MARSTQKVVVKSPEESPKGKTEEVKLVEPEGSPMVKLNFSIVEVEY